MEIKLIRTEEDYQKALERLEVIFNAKRGTREGDELELLSLLIEDYETETEGEYPDPDPVEAIKYRMEQMGLEQKDLVKILGLKSRASEILSRKRQLSLNIIRKLNEVLGIPAEILIKRYELK